MRHRARARSAVVVAVRGTSSVEDVITDSVAEPERLEPEWLPEGAAAAGAGAMFAHGGIKAAAESILAVRPPYGRPGAHARAARRRRQPADGATRRCRGSHARHAPGLCSLTGFAGFCCKGGRVHPSSRAALDGQCRASRPPTCDGRGRILRRAASCRRCWRATMASAGPGSCPPRRSPRSARPLPPPPPLPWRLARPLCWAERAAAGRARPAARPAAPPAAAAARRG